MISSNLKFPITPIIFCCLYNVVRSSQRLINLVYNNSATLIDNIFVNRFNHKISSGNIVLDISDHYSLFCFIHCLIPIKLTTKYKIRDYSNFFEECYVSETRITRWQTDLETNDFLPFYNKLNKLINKHAPSKILSKCKAKQFSKPWINQGLRKSIKIIDCI